MNDQDIDAGMQRAGGVILVILLGALLVCAYLRNSIWNNEWSLWSDTAAKSGNRARAHLNLCVFYSHAGKQAAALAHCGKAIELKQEPFLTRDAYINRGAIHSDLEQYPQALQDYAAALQLFPDDWKTYNNIAYVYAKVGKLDEAVEQYSRAILLNPSYENALFNRATIYGLQKRFQLAINDYTNALQINPFSAITYEKRGYAYLAAGEPRLAGRDFQKACADGRSDACSSLQRIGK